MVQFDKQRQLLYRLIVNQLYSDGLAHFAAPIGLAAGLSSSLLIPSSEYSSFIFKTISIFRFLFAICDVFN